MIRIERVNTIEALEHLEKEWNLLLDRCPQRELYLTHGWIMQWCKHFSNEEELYILLIRDDFRLLGIAPLRRVLVQVKGLTIRRFEFLLNGCSVRSNLIVPTENADSAIRALFRYFSERDEDWEMIHLYGISEASGLLPEIGQAIAEEKQLRILPLASWNNSILPIDGSWESFLKSRSYNFRKNLGVMHRRLNAIGKVTYTSYCHPSEVDDYLKKYLDIERRSWKSESGELVTSHQVYQNFFRETCHYYAVRGLWKGWLTEIDGKPIAASFGFINEGTLYGEKMIYDISFASASAGKAAFAFMVQDAHQQGIIREIDCDQKTSFFEQWTDRTRQYHQVQIFNSRFFSAAIWIVKTRVLPLATRIWARIRGGRK